MPGERVSHNAIEKIVAPLAGGKCWTRQDRIKLDENSG